jgi:GT2 family glycosyltransferase
MKKINFVAVNYNNSKLTIGYIKSILLLDKLEDYHVVIVDNASELSDFANLEEYCNNLKNTNVQLIRSPENSGYFPGLNVGLDAVEKTSDSFSVVSNNDLTFQSDFLVVLRRLNYDQQTCVIAPDVISADGRHQNPHCINHVSRFRVFCYDLYFMNYYFGKLLFWIMQKLKKYAIFRPNEAWKEWQFIHQGIGACYILTEHFFKEYKRLDDRVFLWGEEALLAGQVSRVNGKTLYAPSLVVHHFENASVSKIPSEKSYEIMKNSYKIYRQYL